MAHFPKIVHILYSGVGGLATVGIDLAKAGRADSTHYAAFYGMEPLADINRERAEACGMEWKAFQKEPGMSLNKQREMAEWIISKRPDAVIAHSLAILYACRLVRKRLPGVKIIAVEHHPNALKSAKRWILSALVFWLADRVVYLSQTYINEVKSKIGPLFRASKASLIPNGLDLTEYPLATGAAEGFTVGMQGRFVDAKDFPTLFRALAVANAQPGQKIRLELAGDGPRREEFEALVRELGIESEVHFLGMLDHETLLRHMAKWNVCAHATFGETMSISLMEAKACGLAIVASDANGVSPWFRNGVDGILTPVKDHEAMGRALRQLADDPALCHRLGTEALADAQRNYSSNRAWGAYRKLVTRETSGVPEQAVCVS